MFLFRSPWKPTILRAVALVVLTLLAAMPAAAAPEKIDAYLLTSDERAQMRGFGGKSTNALYWEMRESLERVVADVAGAVRGYYQGRPAPLARVFFSVIGGSPDPVLIEDGRFLFAHACRFQSCTEKGALVVDLSTGQVVLAVLHYFDAKKAYFEHGFLTVARKACADAEFVRYADGRIDRWIKEVLRTSKVVAGDPQAPLPAGAIETPCRKTVPRPEASVMEERIVPDTRPLFRLTRPEIASLRHLAGKPSKGLMDAQPGWSGYRRVFNAIADKKGHYSGDPDEKTASVWSFFSNIVSNAPARLADGRFLLIGGCENEAHCDRPALSIVDVRTGDLAVAIVHRFDVRGTLFYENGHLTTFLASCASAELAAFAKRFLPAWSRKHAVLAYDAVPGRMGKPTTVTTRCR